MNNKNYYPALRMGEKTRTCPGCGAEYVPASRNQKYCTKTCRLHHSTKGATNGN